MENEVKLFVEFLQKMINNIGKCESDFYLSYPIYETILSNNVNIKIHKLLPKAEYQEKLQESDFLLLFRPDWSSEAFSSKFFELLCLRKPIIYFGKEGRVSEFIVKNELGFHVTTKNLEAQIKEITANLTTGRIPNPSYDIGAHTFERHTKLLINELHQL